MSTKEETPTMKLLGHVGRIGCIMSVVVSWHLNHSVLWAFLHALIGWIYVFYAILAGLL